MTLAAAPPGGPEVWRYLDDLFAKREIIVHKEVQLMRRRLHRQYGPKQGHLALMQPTIAAEHVAWRINRKGSVRAYLPEFRCVMDQGGGEGLYLYSQYMSDGDVLEIKLGSEPYQSKIRFEQIFLEKKG